MNNFAMAKPDIEVAYANSQIFNSERIQSFINYLKIFYENSNWNKH